MSFQNYSLHQLGWCAALAQSLTLDDFEAGYPARVTAVHRDGIAVLSSRGAGTPVLTPALREHAGMPAVGDWVLVEHEADRVHALVDRQSLIARLAAGGTHEAQPIAANIDTLFVVTSCNDDFNPSRLERYLALAIDAGVEPVIVLTKADLCDDVADYRHAAERIAPGTVVLTINALDDDVADQLVPWLAPSQTVAFVGSSGVGKSSLTNRLIGTAAQHTAGIREDDARGRHTTTAREMFATATGAWVIDTPGMRELRLGAVEEAVDAVFEEIARLAEQCRFGDCHHDGEPGCAIEQARMQGLVDERRLASYRKLLRESARAQRNERERREQSRQFGAMGKQAMKAKRERLGR